MKGIETGKIEGDLNVEQNYQLDGIVTGSVTVETGVHFQLNGTVNKDVVLLDGSSAQINGTVHGSVINKGGVVRIKGVVGGAVQGDAEISPNAIIGKRA
jgi:cytoskeletal protein CcmA (bactofilin family)